VLASLNHPNIGSIYGLEDAEGITVLVLELVDGPTLAELIETLGSITVPETIVIARQIADALEAAHGVGIIHRDLKPSNIKLRPDGTVKVLDFGLAKALDRSAPGADPSGAVTWNGALTHSGLIVGTPAYMSPEQAAGASVDTRTDIWAFGVVLMEMLTGRRVFTGSSLSEVLANVLRETPDFAALPTDTPEALQRLLRRCLERDRRRRLDSMAVIRLDLEEAAAAPPKGGQSRPEVRQARAWPLLAAVVAGALAATVVMWSTRRAPTALAGAAMTFEFAPPPELPLQISLQAAARDFALASDGSFIVYRTSGGRLAIHRFNALETEVLAAVSGVSMPFVSPDNRWVGFVDDDLVLKKVSVTGGTPITVTTLPVWPRGAAWVDDRTIVVGTSSETAGLLRVPAGGGDAEPLTVPDRSKGEEAHVLPYGLPGARAVLFTIGAASPTVAQIALLDLQSRRITPLVRGGRDAQFLPSGHLVYLSDLGMAAVRFDLSRLQVVGDPIRIIDNLAVAPTTALNAAVTGDGTLVYVPAPFAAMGARSLVFVDRHGKETPVGAPVRAYESVRLSPDGGTLAVGIRDQQNDVWAWSVGRQTLTRLTFDPDVDVSPVWMPDGRRIVFSSARSGAYNLYMLDVNRSGSAVRLTTSADTQLPDSVTADGTSLIAHEVRPRTRSDLTRFPLAPDGRVGAGQALAQTQYNEWNGGVSPDGTLLVFQSVESGDEEIYVAPFPDVARAHWQLSSGGGRAPVWTRGGREVVYLDSAGRLNVVAIERSDGEVRSGSRAMISTSAYTDPVPWRSYDVSADGERFVVIKQDRAAPDSPRAHFVVVQRWFDELRRQLPPQ
jgi:serine/threonine-protein kinase